MGKYSFVVWGIKIPNPQEILRKICIERCAEKIWETPGTIYFEVVEAIDKIALNYNCRTFFLKYQSVFLPPNF